MSCMSQSCQCEAALSSSVGPPQVAEAALADEWVTHGDRLSLQRRVLRLGKPPRRWRKPPWAAAAMHEPREIRLMARPLSSIVGKPLFQGALPPAVLPRSSAALQIAGQLPPGRSDRCNWQPAILICDGCRSPRRNEEPLHRVRWAGMHRRGAGAAALRQPGGRRLARCEWKHSVHQSSETRTELPATLPHVVVKHKRTWNRGVMSALCRKLHTLQWAGSTHGAIAAGRHALGGRRVERTIRAAVVGGALHGRG